MEWDQVEWLERRIGLPAIASSSTFSSGFLLTELFLTADLLQITSST
jgi:hypothetical protein